MSPALNTESQLTSFQYRTVPYIVCDIGAAKEIGVSIRERFPIVRRLMIVTDAGVMRAGLLEKPLASLMQCGLYVTVFANVVADPPEAVVEEAAAKAHMERAELVIGFGGGSSMDVAKLVAAMVAGDQPLSAMYGIDKVVGQRLPLIQIPTTAGTGSEVTPIAIVTTGETTKMGVVSPALYADVALLDAELTAALPPHVTATTGIDAIVHAIEAYTSRHRKNPMSDMLARQALQLLSSNIAHACECGSDLGTRQAMLVGAMLAGQAFANAPVAAVHALAYPIGGIFHVPHGLSNALVLPHVLRFNMSEAAPHYAELAGIIAPDARGSDEARSDAMISALERLAARIGIPGRLGAVGITDADIDRLADDAMLQTRLLGNNPREVTRADAHAIYRAAL